VSELRSRDVANGNGRHPGEANIKLRRGSAAGHEGNTSPAERIRWRSKALEVVKTIATHHPEAL
jgi:hypothetical protein